MVVLRTCLPRFPDSSNPCSVIKGTWYRLSIIGCVNNYVIPGESSYMVLLGNFNHVRRPGILDGGLFSRIGFLDSLYVRPRPVLELRGGSYAP